MANLSRTEKYKELRDKLQHDNGSELSTRELSRFEKRLNHIDAENFAAPKEYQEEHEAVHGRKAPAESVMPETKPEPKPAEPGFDFSSLFEDNENDSTADNDFLDQYIREVKQYNIDQGNALSENTSLNILRQMGNLPQSSQTSAPLRPYPAEKPAPVQKKPEPVRQDTADIPFTRPAPKPQPKPQVKQEQTDELPVLKPITADSSTMSRDDIMAEVQNLVNNAKPGHQAPPAKQEDDTRRQLLNETTQMRAQLDDYEDNLSEVNDRMQQTNRILHMVLIVLIAAMLVVFGLVIYFIVLARGV